MHALQTLSLAMGDTLQVFSRELRGWGAAECGLFGSLSGAGAMVASLLSRRSVKTLGTRAPLDAFGGDHCPRSCRGSCCNPLLCGCAPCK